MAAEADRDELEAERMRGGCPKRRLRLTLLPQQRHIPLRKQRSPPTHRFLAVHRAPAAGTHRFLAFRPLQVPLSRGGNFI